MRLNPSKAAVNVADGDDAGSGLGRERLRGCPDQGNREKEGDGTHESS